MFNSKKTGWHNRLLFADFHLAIQVIFRRSRISREQIFNFIPLMGHLLEKFKFKSGFQKLWTTFMVTRWKKVWWLLEKYITGIK